MLNAISVLRIVSFVMGFPSNQDGSFFKDGRNCFNRWANHVQCQGDWTFFKMCSGTRPLLPLESPEGRQKVARASEGRSSSRRPGSEFRPMFSSRRSPRKKYAQPWLQEIPGFRHSLRND